MGIFAIVEGNLTKNPEGRQVIVSGEPRSIVELRVFADVNRKVGDRWEQDDERSKGVDVTIWSEALGKAVLQHYRKGARVKVEGDLHLNEYDDADGVHHAGLPSSTPNCSFRCFPGVSLNEINKLEASRQI